MADKKISQLTELTTVDPSNDVLAIVDFDTSETKKVKPQNLPFVSNNQSDTTPINTIRKLTQAEYDAITPDANTFYIVT